MLTALNSTGTTVSITPESSLLLGEGLLGVSFLKVFGREGWAPALEWWGGTGLGIHLANLGGKETEGLRCVEGEGLGLLVRATEPGGRGLRSLGLREDGVRSIILGGRVDLSATKQGAGIPDWRTQEGSGPGGKQL